MERFQRAPRSTGDQCRRTGHVSPGDLRDPAESSGLSTALYDPPGALSQKPGLPGLRWDGRGGDVAADVTLNQLFGYNLLVISALLGLRLLYVVSAALYQSLFTQSVIANAARMRCQVRNVESLEDSQCLLPAVR